MSKAYGKLYRIASVFKPTRDPLLSAMYCACGCRLPELGVLLETECHDLHSWILCSDGGVTTQIWWCRGLWEQKNNWLVGRHSADENSRSRRHYGLSGTRHWRLKWLSPIWTTIRQSLWMDTNGKKLTYRIVSFHSSKIFSENTFQVRHLLIM